MREGWRGGGGSARQGGVLGQALYLPRGGGGLGVHLSRQVET